MSLSWHKVWQSCDDDDGYGNYALMLVAVLGTLSAVGVFLCLWSTRDGVGLHLVGIGMLAMALSIVLKLVAGHATDVYKRAHADQTRLAWRCGQRDITLGDITQEITRLNGLIGQERMRCWTSMEVTASQEQLLAERRRWMTVRQELLDGHHALYRQTLDEAVRALNAREPLTVTD